MLAIAKVKHFVIPATTEAESIWINKFGFSRVITQEVRIIRQTNQLLFFGSYVESFIYIFVITLTASGVRQGCAPNVLRRNINAA